MAMGRMARYWRMEGKSRVIGKEVIEDRSRHLVGRLASRRISRKEFWSWRKKLILLDFFLVSIFLKFFSIGLLVENISASLRVYEK